MNITRKIATAIAVFGLAASALADTYPSHPVRFIIGTQAGGMASVLARTLADGLAKSLGQPVIVEERPGANGLIAAKLVMSAAPDGYTLLVDGINPHPLIAKNGIDLSKEMEMVGMVSSVPMVFLTTAGRKLDSVRAVVDYAKANPGRLDFGSSGGTYWNLMMKVFTQRAGGFSYTNVPYKGSADLQLALPRGDIQITMMTPPSSLPMVASGKARAILIAAPTRSPILPDVPTPAEAGLLPFSVSSTMYLWAPKGTPGAVIDKLSTAMLGIAKDEKYRKAVIEKTGAQPPAYTRAEASEQFAAEVQQAREALAKLSVSAKP